MKHSSRPTTPTLPSPPINSFSPQDSSYSTIRRPSTAPSPIPSSTITRPLTSQSSSSTVQSRSSHSPTIHSAINHHHPPQPNQVAGQGYTPKVGFDTFSNPVASMFSYTLHVQSDGYTRNRATRVFLCAASPDESGSQALDWALDALVRDGDELIVLRGIDQEDLGRWGIPIISCQLLIPGYRERSRSR